jgi:hypothetical protein
VPFLNSPGVSAFGVPTRLPHAGFSLCDLFRAPQPTAIASFRLRCLRPVVVILGMFQSLRIDAFRGLSDLDFDPLSRINVLTGFNNSGKTSVLEALYLLWEDSSN